MFAFQKTRRAWFSLNTRFEIFPFALLPRISAKQHSILKESYLIH